MRRVTIAGKEYPYRYDFGAMLHYEQLVKRMQATGVELSAYMTSALMHYACLLSGEEFEMTYEAFLSSIDTKEAYEMLNAAFEAEFSRWENCSYKPADNQQEDTERKKK